MYYLIFFRGVNSYHDVALDEIELNDKDDVERFIEYLTDDANPTDFIFYAMNVTRIRGLRRYVVNIIFDDRVTGRKMKSYYDAEIYPRIVQNYFDNEIRENGYDVLPLSLMAARIERRNCGRIRSRRYRRNRNLPRNVIRQIERSMMF